MRLQLISLVLLVASNSSSALDSETFQGKASDRLGACKEAKDSARRSFVKPSLNQAMGKRFAVSECDCEEDSSSSVFRWTCNVDAEWEQSSNQHSTSSKPSTIQVKSAEGKGDTETEGCSGAKYFGERSLPPFAKIRGYENCMCSLTNGSSFRYVCSIDVFYEL